MQILGIKRLTKFKQKNKGNVHLVNAIDNLINDFKKNCWNDYSELKKVRPEADKVHNEGFYFFDIDVHRTMVLIEFDDKKATVVWVGTHQEYDQQFKNNKNTIKKWLKSQEWI